jgi:hypothetical protein
LNGHSTSNAWEPAVKKGRHRRFEEARALKRSFQGDLDNVLLDEDEIAPAPPEPCDECGAAPGAAHASWCLATAEDPYDGYDSADDD